MEEEDQFWDPNQTEPDYMKFLRNTDFNQLKKEMSLGLYKGFACINLPLVLTQKRSHKYGEHSYLSSRDIEIYFRVPLI